MWSQNELDSIFARTGLVPPSAFLEAAEAMRLDIPSPFEGGGAANQCDALYFHNTCGENLGDLPLIEIGFLPFWQENNHCETVLIGCRSPFVGCVGAYGILVNEEGGLISGNFAEFFALLKRQIADHPHESLLSELIFACAYSARFVLRSRNMRTQEFENIASKGMENSILSTGRCLKTYRWNCWLRTIS